MAKIKFFTRPTVSSKKNKDLPLTIYMRFTHGAKVDLSKSTGLTVPLRFWNNNKGEPKNVISFLDRINLNNSLNKLHGFIINAHNKDLADGVRIDSDWLERQISVCFKKTYSIECETLISHQAAKCIDSLPSKIYKGKIGASQSTIRKYRTVAKKVKEFEIFRKKKIHVHEVDMACAGEFTNYLIDVDKLCLNSVGRYLKVFKSFCTFARSNGLSTHHQLNDIKGFTEKVDFIVFNDDEINLLYDLSLERDSMLDNARDWLIIGIWTALRVSDLLELTSANIIDNLIHVTHKKTNQQVELPIHGMIENILNKRDFEFPRKISSQKFNDYIKIVAKKAGLLQKVKGARLNKVTKRKENGVFEKWELVTSHICRRTFATIHFGEFPTVKIMELTGHKSESQFLDYIGKTYSDSAKSLAEYWANK
ncbi:tyrosine-type recombinase/integrase [Roseivirga sp.]|uniref:tyrosine-type recombinase/integrase n=1 Tax=Roseivirga sp. TaxID=1964215 RepID=UPI003B8BD2FC